MNSKKMLAVIYKEGRQWVSQCLNVDVASCGKTSVDALRNLEEAVILYFDEPQRHPRMKRLLKKNVFVRELEHV